MNKKSILIILVVLLAIGGISYWALTSSENQAPTTKTDTTDQKQQETAEPEPELEETEESDGRYEDYSEDQVVAEGYDTNIIFFHAPWCPECRAFEKEILASTIPGGVQILKADFDSETELRKRYGVTQQTTFVKVDDDGAEVAQWSGYGESKSVGAILENLN